MLPARPASPAPTSWPVYVYKDVDEKYFSSGYFGDAASLILSDDFAAAPGEGFTSKKVQYSGVGTNGFAGVYWQNPANNWGTVSNGGLNLTGAQKLKFMARGAVNGVKIQVTGGGILGQYGDTYKAQTSVLTLTNAWQSYEIALTGKTLTHVLGGFAFTVTKADNPTGATFYLDNIRYDNGTVPPARPASPTPASWPFYIYKDAHDKFLPTGFMGDAASLTVLDTDFASPGEGIQDIKITYSGVGTNGFAGIYWQSPANNWGTVSNGGFNLTGGKTLSFMAKSSVNGVKATFTAGGITGTYGDTFKVQTTLLTLTNAWKTYTIDLTGRDLSHVVGGFAFTLSKTDNPTGATIFLDNIYYNNGTAIPVPPTPPAPSALPLYVYQDAHDKYGPTGWIGDTTALTFSDTDTTLPHEGLQDIKVTYNGVGPNGFAGIIWQNPNGNWGTVSNGGLNLTGAKTLRFWARGQVGGEKIQFQGGGVLGTYGDTFKVAGPVVALTTAWQQFQLDLTGKNLTRVVGGFGFTASKADNPSGATFYLDKIEFDNGTEPVTPPPNSPPPTPLPLFIFKDAHDKYGPTGWMGDAGDMTFSDTDVTLPGEGTKSIKIVYSGVGSSGQNWAGIYWQNPNGNWGTVSNGGLNLTGAVALKFMARGQTGGEKVQFIGGGVVGTYGDTFKVTGPVVSLTTAWQTFQLDVTGRDLTRVVGGFCFVVSKPNNPAGATFYLDNIRYE